MSGMPRGASHMQGASPNEDDDASPSSSKVNDERFVLHIQAAFCADQKKNNPTHSIYHIFPIWTQAQSNNKRKRSDENNATPSTSKVNTRWVF